MKNYKIQLFVCVVFSSLFFTSCENYLDEQPDDRLELDTVEKVAKLVANSYSAGSYAFTDTYTDLAGPTGNPDNDGISQNSGGNLIRIQDEQTYLWEDVDAIFQDTPTYFWDQTYEAIAHTNEALATIDNIEGDIDFKNAIKGEALLSRAYHHFMLVNVFGLHYDSNASTNLGIPYITTPETDFLPTYERNTVAEVYNLVEKDLIEGLALVDDRFFSGSAKYHFTRKAGQAFASRFYLWKGDYENCKKYSDLFLDGSPSVYIKNYDNIQGSDYNSIADSYNDPQDESNVLLVQKFSLHQRRNVGFRLNISDLSTLFDNPLNSADERLSTGIWNVNTDARYLARLREYFFRENLSANSGLAYYIAVEFKGEEVLLNRAEANLMLGNQSEALNDINTLARERYYDQEFTDITAIVDYYQATSEMDGLLQLIIDERKKEFWDHGLRWFDIKRFNIPVTHTLPVSEGGETFELPVNDPRRAVQIPADAISYGITPNPR